MCWFVIAATALLCLVADLRTAELRSCASDENVLLLQSQADADRKSAGCLTCHTATDSPTMHVTGTVRLGCTDCHGGNSEARIAADSRAEFRRVYRGEEASASAAAAMSKDAHSSANPSAPTPTGCAKTGTTSAS